MFETMLQTLQYIVYDRFMTALLITGEQYTQYFLDILYKNVRKGCKIQLKDFDQCSE